jgi:hypothetical protein
VLLAEFEIWHSRPIAPTRRVALGSMMLPVDPAPGFGGLLLGAVMAVNLHSVDEDLVPDVHRLLGEIERGERVAQPRLRHRFQVDRHGLAVSRHRLLGDDDTVRFEIDSVGAPLQQVLGAVYALERLDAPVRRAVVPTLRRAMTWNGPMGADFVNHLVGRGTSSIAAAVDPRAWALDVLGFPGGTVRFTKREVMDRFRERLRTAHPDHGGDEGQASRAIGDITEARRVLLDAL